MRRAMLAAVVVGMLMLCAAPATAARMQDTDPVTDKAIDKGIYSDFEGKRIFFSREESIGAFGKDPRKYLNKLRESGQECAAAPKPQTICPVDDIKCSTSDYADYKGKRVFFCSAACAKEFQNNPEKYFAAAQAGGVTLMPTPRPQTLCPVMGSPINKSIHVDYEGKRIYFCCKACPEVFKKSPAKYMRKFKEQNVVLEDAPAAAGAK